ncbi:hypothetical protein K488DRAFT_62012, partial [Vararia minispora EC-137]
RDMNCTLRRAEWSLAAFEYPRISPCTDALENIPPRAYRPFKEGTYHVTMGIRSMDFDEWIEASHISDDLDSEFFDYHRIRSERLAERGSKLIQVLPDRAIVRGAGPAAGELVQELCEFLSRRYPGVFEVVRDASSQGWYGEGKVTNVKIVPTNECFDLRTEDPMRVAAMLVPDDLAILIEGNDGKYYLQGGAILVPGTWRLEDKIGMPLDEIHVTGHVPYYEERLQPSLTRFFTKLPVSRPVVRNNWFFQSVEPHDPRDTEELAWYTSVLGSEDTFQHVPSSYKLESPSAPRIDRLRLRSERQSLRRLPRTGAIVFTIRTYKTPIEKLAKEPGMAARLASALHAVQTSAPEVYKCVCSICFIVLLSQSLDNALRRMLSMEGLEKLLLEYLDAQTTADIHKARGTKMTR